MLVGCQGDATPREAPAPAPAAGPVTETPRAATESPWCGVIAFVSERDGNPEIYALRPDGAPARLTEHPAGDFVTPLEAPVDGARALVMIRAEELPGGAHRERLGLLSLEAGEQPRFIGPPSGRLRNPSAGPGGAWLVLESDAHSFRDLYRVELTGASEGRAPLWLTDNLEGNFEPAVSPDGQRIAFVSSRDGDAELYLMQADGSRPHRLTNRPGDDTAPSWSPDGRALAFTRADADGSRVFLLALEGADVAGEPRPLRSSAPARGEDRDVSWSPDGARIALSEAAPGRAEVVVFDVATGAEVELDAALFPDPWSIRDLHWSADGQRLFFVHVQRGHQVVKLLELDVRTSVTRAVIDERPATFFDYANKLFVRHLEAADEVLWLSERNGWNHLWRVSRATGVATPVTVALGPTAVIRSVDEVDEAARTARVRVMGLYPDQDPYHEHFARVDLDTGVCTPLTSADGTHTLDLSPDGAHFVATWQRVDQPPVRELRRAADGALVCELSRGDTLVASGLMRRMPERFVAPGRDGATPIWGVLYRPSDFDPAQRYPVIEQIYAGPHGAHVPKTFDLAREPQRLAELGFIVAQIDGMGTNWRSKAFHDVAWKDLADAGFPDRIAWLRAAAAERPELDLTRVGIYGGSAGGQNALRAVLDHADFYRAAAADCGCHDNRMDKVWWNE
ncbi:MAG: PD40 domain-containing protein, partial [Myxococcales bacterium]|nr:PD40 domain-containing protein [Myxococcales bacterium]